MDAQPTNQDKASARDAHARMDTHEAVCALRYEGINSRLRRLESILIGGAGSIIVLMVTIIMKLNGAA